MSPPRFRLQGREGTRKLFLAPHNDDETLFGFFTLMRESPQVVVVLQGEKQPDVPPGVRTDETSRAMSLTESRWDQWRFSDAAPDWLGIEERLRELAPRYDHVWAPAIEADGHDQHNEVGRLAGIVWPDNVTHYMTYRRGYGASTSDNEVAHEPPWVAAKLRALACYGSQIATPATASWFTHNDLREWYQ